MTAKAGTIHPSNDGAATIAQAVHDVITEADYG